MIVQLVIRIIIDKEDETKNTLLHNPNLIDLNGEFMMTLYSATIRYLDTLKHFAPIPHGGTKPKRHMQYSSRYLHICRNNWA